VFFNQSVHSSGIVGQIPEYPCPGRADFAAGRLNSRFHPVITEITFGGDLIQDFLMNGFFNNRNGGRWTELTCRLDRLIIYETAEVEKPSLLATSA